MIVDAEIHELARAVGLEVHQTGAGHAVISLADGEFPGQRRIIDIISPWRALSETTRDRVYRAMVKAAIVEWGAILADARAETPS